MNSLGTSSADFKKYDEFKAQKSSLFNKGADVLLAYIKNNPDTTKVDIFSQLKNIYNALNETEKAKEIAAKIEAMTEGE